MSLTVDLELNLLCVNSYYGKNEVFDLDLEPGMTLMKMS